MNKQETKELIDELHKNNGDSSIVKNLPPKKQEKKQKKEKKVKAQSISEKKPETTVKKVRNYLLCEGKLVEKGTLYFNEETGKYETATKEILKELFKRFMLSELEKGTKKTFVTRDFIEKFKTCGQRHGDLPRAVLGELASENFLKITKDTEAKRAVYHYELA
jgi:hypothetical protein